MTHRPAWTCSHCRYQLGEVRGQSVEVWVPKPRIGPDAAGVRCPRCDTLNVWRRQVETTGR